VRFAVLGLALLGACASASAQNARSAFSLPELFADAPGYLRSHYRPEELPGALTADLLANGFRCVAAPNADICDRDHPHSPAPPHCFYTDYVSYDREPRRIVAIWDAPRCMGALPPATR